MLVADVKVGSRQPGEGLVDDLLAKVYPPQYSRLMERPEKLQSGLHNETISRDFSDNLNANLMKSPRDRSLKVEGLPDGKIRW